MDTGADQATGGDRPKSMTVAAVLLLGGALLGAGALLLTLASGAAAPDAGLQPVDPAQGATAAAGALARALAGFGVLRRWGWTRWVYAAWAVPVSGLTLAADPLEPRAILACALTWLIVALLITPVAGAWFRGSGGRAEVADVFR